MLTVFCSLAAGAALLGIYMKCIATVEKDFWPAVVITVGIVGFLICLF